MPVTLNVLKKKKTTQNVPDVLSAEKPPRRKTQRVAVSQLPYDEHRARRVRRTIAANLNVLHFLTGR
jgi:hypothetical protein